MLEKNNPKIAAAIHTPTEVALRPNFSAKIADKGMKAAKQSVAKVEVLKTHHVHTPVLSFPS